MPIDFSISGPIKDKQEQQEADFQRVGLDVLKDQGIDARVKALEEVRTHIYGTLQGDTPEQKLENLHSRLENVDQILRTVSIPYCAAGGRDQGRGLYAALMEAWETTRSLTHSAILTNYRLMQKAELEDTEKDKKKDSVKVRLRKEELLRKIQFLFVNFTAKYALLTTDLAWFPEHVGHPWAMVVYSPPVQRGWGIDLNKEAETL